MGIQSIKTIRFQRTSILQRVAYDRTLRFPQKASRRKELFWSKVQSNYKNRLWRNAGLKGMKNETLHLRDYAAHMCLYSIDGNASRSWEELTESERRTIQVNLFEMRPDEMALSGIALGEAVHKELLLRAATQAQEIYEE